MNLVKLDLTNITEEERNNLIDTLTNESCVISLDSNNVRCFLGTTCGECKYAVRTKDGEFNPNDIVCSMWCTDGFKAGDFCSRGEEGVYVPDDNCIQDQEGYL
jgi:hypothetical protein